MLRRKRGGANDFSAPRSAARPRVPAAALASAGRQRSRGSRMTSSLAAARARGARDQGRGPGRADQGGKLRGWPVSRILSGVAPWMTIPLGLRSRAASSRQPGPLGAKLPCRAPLPGRTARDPYSALLPVGLAMPVLLPVPRWALTPPFHPCRSGLRRSLLCGAFPGVAPAGRYPAPLLHGVRTFLGPPAVRETELWGAAVIRPSAPGRHRLPARARQAGARGALPPLGLRPIHPRDICGNWKRKRGQTGGSAGTLPPVVRRSRRRGARRPRAAPSHRSRPSGNRRG